MAVLLEGEQLLDLVGIVAGKAAGHDFAAAARLDGNVGKEDVLIDVDAGNGPETDLCLFATDDFRFAVGDGFFFVVDNDFIGKHGVPVARYSAGGECVP